jgi:hypothetical protein
VSTWVKHIRWVSPRAVSDQVKRNRPLPPPRNLPEREAVVALVEAKYSQKTSPRGCQVRPVNRKGVLRSPARGEREIVWA